MNKEELEKKIDELEDKVQELWDESFKREDGWDWYCKAPEHKELSRLRRQYKLLLDENDYTLSPLPDFGDHMTLKKFVDYCLAGGFVDSDGFGNYATKDKESDIVINPSDVISGMYRKDFTHVVWYNK